MIDGSLVLGILLQQAVADNYLAPILVGLALAFVTQAVASWVATAATRQQVSSLADDIKELQELHPRRSLNPGKRHHRPADFCINAKCAPPKED